MRHFGRRKPTAEGAQRAALLKFRRGTVNAVEWPEIKLVLDALDWPQVETVAFAPVTSGSESYDTEKILAAALGVPERDPYWNMKLSGSPLDPTKLVFWAYNGPPQPGYGPSETPQQTHARFAPVALPAEPEPGRVYVTECSPLVAKKKQGNPMLTWSARASYGVKAIQITAPDGAVGAAYLYPGEKRPRKGVIAAWMLEHGALPQILALLGIGEHIPGNPVNRTIQNTGTCGACESNVKRDGRGRMVHHGYERPGYGYIVGDCIGVGLLPFELSPEGAIEVEKIMAARLRSVREALANLREGRVRRFTDRRGRPPNEREVVIEPDHPEWPSRLRSAIYQREAEESHISRDLARVQKRISEWRCAPLPDGTVEPCP